MFLGATLPNMHSGYQRCGEHSALVTIILILSQQGFCQ